MPSVARIVKVVRRGPFDRVRVRRGGRSVLWLVQVDGVTRSEHFTRRGAREWATERGLVVVK